MMKRSRSEIIELLGGWQAVADEFDLVQSAISNWKTRGIPPGRWLALERFAATRRPVIEPPITAEEIEEANKESVAVRPHAKKAEAA